jgi:hypothetical protein
MRIRSIGTGSASNPDNPARAISASHDRFLICADATSTVCSGSRVADDGVPHSSSHCSIGVLEFGKRLQGILRGTGEYHLLVAHLEGSVGHNDVFSAHA